MTIENIYLYIFFLFHFYDTLLIFCCCSVLKSCPILCDPMNYILPDSSIPYYLLELAQIHVHWVGNGIYSSHPLPFLPPSAFYPSQHQGLFQWEGSKHQVAEVLEFQLQQWTQQWMFQWTFRTNFLQDWLLCSCCSPRLLTLFSSITIWNHQFFSTQPFLMDQSTHPFTTEITTGITLTNGLLSTKWWLCFLICCLGLS